MLSQQLSLLQTVLSLRNNELNLLDYIKQTEKLVKENERLIKALIPEKGRFQRIKKEAEELLSKYPHPKMHRPLFGILVGVKDIFHIKGFPTQAGSTIPAAELTGPEAAVVTILKNAGALILGKTVTTEFAYFEPGPTRNPHNLNHTPGGSSSGSAAAVAAGYSPLALGTQTIGSTIRPAAFCNIAGYKPTYGRISPEGIIPFSISTDHVGLFAQGITGMGLVASLLCRNWRSPAPPDKLPVLGIPTGPYMDQVERKTIGAFYEQISLLKNNGYQVKEVPVLNDLDAVSASHHRLIAAEFARIHEKWFTKFGNLYKDKTIDLILAGRRVSDGELKQVRFDRIQLRKHIVTTMDEVEVDLWVTPGATGPAPEAVSGTGDPAMSLPWTNSGLPSLYIPGKLDKNMVPLGLQLVARFMCDEELLSWGEEMEKIIHRNNL